MIIEKQQRDSKNYRNRILFYPRARDAFQELLGALKCDSFTLLLPAFIGISPKEGSGLYDPVCNLNIQHLFYRMTGELEIDVDDLVGLMQSVSGQKAVLLVHYWGFVDKNYEKIAAKARENQCFLIEDLAHAFYTEYVDYKCGYLADACFYSLHKVFPNETGGMLKIRSSGFEIQNRTIEYSDWEPILCYDLKAIAQKRKENARLWESLLEGENDKFEPLRSAELWKGQTPQTFPVRVLNADRYQIYQELNEKGYGVISLYHTMIQPIQDKHFDESIRLSQQILNLPVHQDVSAEQIYTLHAHLLQVHEKYMK